MTVNTCACCNEDCHAKAKRLERELAVERATTASLGATVEALRDPPSAVQDRNAIIEECARVCDAAVQDIYDDRGSTDQETGERIVPSRFMDTVEAFEESALRIRALKNTAPQVDPGKGRPHPADGDAGGNPVPAGAAPLPSSVIDSLIENSGGFWREDQFIIEGGELKALLQTAAGMRQCPEQRAEWARYQVPVEEEGNGKS